MIRRFILAVGLAAAAFLTGCAHPISVTPDLAQIKGSGAPKINKSVGYYIAPEDRSREVVTPGGGGDKVSYVPYRDLEAGMYKAMSEVFANVTKLDSVGDTSRLAKDGIQLVIAPKIVTTSSSDSLLTWPPTQFTIELACKVTDKSGLALTEVKAFGSGRAEFGEFKSDFSLSAKRAAQDAMAKLVKALETAPELRR